MDNTQRLPSDDEDEDVSLVNRDRPVGNLHMFAGIHGPAQDFPIYLGQNLIGRHASCDITLPAQSVSKKHAILEVKADCHTICDNSSLNKTRRSKAALAPNVRYALSDGDFLMFADVACRYTIEKPPVEAPTVEDSEDDSVLVPATQGALAIEKTPGVAIRRMVRGAVLAMDSGDEDEAGFRSFKASNKSSGLGAIFSPITDTIVPESDEENETSLSESHLPSLNLRCDSDTDTHETPTRGSFLTPSSKNIVTPLSDKDESRTSEPADKEEGQDPKQTDEAKTLTLSTDVGSDVKESQEGEQKEKSVSEGDVSGDGRVMTADTSSVKSREDTNLNSEDNVDKQALQLSTSNPCVEDSEDKSFVDVVQGVSDEMKAKNVTTEEKNTELVNPDPKTTVSADFCIDSDTDVDEEEETTSDRSGNKESEAVQAENEQVQAQNSGENLESSDASFHIDDAATAGCDLESAKTLQENVECHADEEAVKATNADPNKSASTDGRHDSDTDVEDDRKALKSENENVEEGVKGGHDRTSASLEIHSDSDVENTTDIGEPEEKSTEQDPGRSNEQKVEGFHLDSDTDVEEDVSTTEGKKDEWTTSSTANETKHELHLDSDTDVDEDVNSSAKEEQGGKTKQSDVQVIKDGFHLDSDTDVDDDVPIPGASNTSPENRQPSEIHTGAQEKVEITKSHSINDDLDTTNDEASALQMDEDTDVDEDDAPAGVSTVEEAQTAQEVVTAEKNDMDVSHPGVAAFHMDSDTDVEDDEDKEPVLGLEKVPASEGSQSGGATEDHETVQNLAPTVDDTADVSDGVKVETSSVAAEDTTEEEESQKSDSENANYELMATQCYLEQQEQESEIPGSELPDEEEATQAYLFSSTWAEPDPFKRPADPIGVLQISAVTMNSSEDEIDETAIAETQPYFSEADSPSVCRVQETPELGNDSASEQEKSEPVDHVEETSEEVQPLTCGTVSQEDTQPISQNVADSPPQEPGYWLHLKRDVPASAWVRSIEHEGADSNLKHDQDEEIDQTNEPDTMLAAEDLQTPAVLAVQEHPTQAPSPDVPPAEEAGAEPGISALPLAKNEVVQPCNLETQVADEQATREHDVPDCTDKHISNSNVHKDDDVQPPKINVGVTESDNTQHVSPESQVKLEDTNETSNKGGKGKQPARRGLSRSRRRGESVKDAQNAAETVEHLVSDSLPEKLNECDDEAPKESAAETKEELKAEKGGRRRGTKRAAAVEVEEPKEEAASSGTRKRSSRMAPEAEPSTTGLGEKAKRQKLTGSIKATKEDLEDECKEESEPVIEESKEIQVTENLQMNPTGTESQAADLDKSDLVKQLSGNNENQEKENDVEASADLGNSDTNFPSVSSSDLPNKKLAPTRRRAAAKQKKVDTVETESKEDGDKTPNKDINNHKSKAAEDDGHQDKVKEPTGRILGAEEEQKTFQGTKNTASLTEQMGESSSGMETSRRLRRSLTEEFKAESKEQLTPRKSTSTRGGAKKSQDQESKGNSEDSLASNTTQRRTKRLKEEAVKPEVPKVEINEDVDPVKKPRRTRKNVKDEQKTEEDPKTSDAQTSSQAKEESGVEEIVGKAEAVKETRRSLRNSKDEDVTKLEEQSKKSTRTRKGSKEETKTEQHIETSAETHKEVSKRTTHRTRGNVKVDGEPEVKPTKNNSKSERSSPRIRRKASEETQEGPEESEKVEESEKKQDVEEKTRLTTGRSRRTAVKEDVPQVSPPEKQDVEEKKRLNSGRSRRIAVKEDIPQVSTPVTARTRRKALTEETQERPEESVKVEELVKESEEKQDVEEKTRLTTGRSRRTAVKEDIPQVSTPVTARKRGQSAKAEVETKRKKSDTSEEVKGDVAVAETTPSRRGRPRKMGVDLETTQMGSAVGKVTSPPDPSPSRNTRGRPSPASSNPSEVRTPRRTNRTSTLAGATSPYVPQSGSAPKVLFTGVVDAAGEEVIRSLGGDIADSVFDCTHLVTDRVRRTVKFLCALARGIPIVTLDWIEKCKKSRCFLSPTGFLVHDKEQEKNFNFVLAESLQKAKRRLLFEGYEIHITPNVKPEPEHMKDILRCSGATFLPKAPRTFKEKCVVVSCLEDTARCKTVPASIPITTAEFILSGILRQEVNPAAYLLNPAGQSATPTPAKRRR